MLVDIPRVTADWACLRSDCNCAIEGLVLQFLRTLYFVPVHSTFGEGAAARADRGGDSRAVLIASASAASHIPGGSHLIPERTPWGVGEEEGKSGVLHE